MSRSATLSRSVTLFRAFLHEQDDPDGFYSVLAADSVAQLSRWADLSGATVLDVGEGRATSPTPSAPPAPPTSASSRTPAR